MSPEVAAATAVVAAIGGALVPAGRLARGAPGRWTSPVLVSTLAALGGAGAALLADSWIELVTFALLALGCSVLVAVDLACHRLPDVVVLPTAVALVGGLALAAATADAWPGFGRALLGGVVLGVGFLAMALISPRALGLGDVKLAALLGIFLGWFGWSAVLAGVVATFLLGGAAALILVAFTRASRSTALAFGPWLVLGAAAGAHLASAGAAPTP